MRALARAECMQQYISFKQTDGRETGVSGIILAAVIQQAIMVGEAGEDPSECVCA